MTNNCTPILVTGIHRSGSTWVGKMISFSRDVRYLDEPFNPSKNHLRIPNDIWSVDVSFLPQKMELEYYNYLKQTLYSSPYNILNQLNQLQNVKGIKSLQRILKGFGNINIRLRPLIKDPIALFSAEWISTNFNSQNIILIRHPAAFIASTLLKSWSYNPIDFLKQPDIINSEFLKPFKTRIEDYIRKVPPLIDQNILAYCIIHHRIIKYQRKFPDWYFIKHEDLSLDPINEFKKIYNYLDLDYTNKIKLKISNFSRSNNSSNKEGIKRNSKETTILWKLRLTKNQIRKIKDETSIYWKEFYQDNDWN